MTEERAPLVEIRSAELAAARALSEAGESAEQAVAEARSAAAGAVDQARAEGRAAADGRFSDTIEQAESEAGAISAAIDDNVKELRRQIGPRIEHLAEKMLDQLLPEGSG